MTLDTTASSVAGLVFAGADPAHGITDDFPILAFRESLLLYWLSQRKVRYISGHFPFSKKAHDYFRDCTCFITILRDPIARYRSCYLYNRYTTGTLRSTTQTFDEYLKSPFGRSQGHEYVKFLGGPRADGDYTSRNAIERAKSAIGCFTMIGFLDALPSFVVGLRERVGVRVAVGIKNASPARLREQMTEEFSRKEATIREICAPDIEVYEAARRYWLG